MSDVVLRSPSFRAVVRAEIIFNMTRALPYVLMLLFIGNAVLWWGRGPATHFGWAVNSEFYILRLFTGFTFMTLPLFTALVMADPVNRDFDIGIDPLIFSKPIRRIQYLAGKFIGNFFVLAACQATFALTLIVLQAFRTSGMIVLPVRVLPYIQHFVVITMVTQLALAAVCFTIGTIARNSRAAFLGVVALYFGYAAWQVFVLRGLPAGARTMLDPLLMNFQSGIGRNLGAQALSTVAVDYSAGVIANRVLMIIVAIGALTVLHFAFAHRELVAAAPRSSLQLLDLSAPADRTVTRAAIAVQDARQQSEPLALPDARISTTGWRARTSQLRAAFRTELRLLAAERGVLIAVPLVVLLITISLAAFRVTLDLDYSGAYARRSAEALWPLILGVVVFYSGVLIHREREMRIEPLVWSAPVANATLLLAKLSALIAVLHVLVFPTLLAAAALQAKTHHGAVAPLAYVRVYFVVLLPGILFISAAAFALNTLLRDRLVTYAVSIGVCGGIFYLYLQGYNHWLYNPLLYGLWSYARLAGADRATLQVHALYVVGAALVAFGMALLAFVRTESPADGVRRAGALLYVLMGAGVATSAAMWIALHT